MFVSLFCILIALWIFILIQTQIFLPCLIALIFSIGIFMISFKQPKIQLPKTLLGFGKGILLISFWACVGFCLLAYQKSITCINCIYNYLKQDNFLNANIILKMWALYPRFIIISGLFTLWIILFFLICKKGHTND